MQAPCASHLRPAALYALRNTKRCSAVIEDRAMISARPGPRSARFRQEAPLKSIFTLVALATILPLAACNSSPSDKLADRVENAADNRADAMEANADMLRNQAARLDNRAEKARDTAESRADAIEAADMNVAGMSQERRDAIVANQAAAVR